MIILRGASFIQKICFFSLSVSDFAVDFASMIFNRYAKAIFNKKPTLFRRALNGIYRVDLSATTSANTLIIA